MLLVTSCDEIWSVERASESVDVCSSRRQSKLILRRQQTHDMAKAQCISGKQMTHAFMCFHIWAFFIKKKQTTINRNPGVLGLGDHMTVSDSWHQISLLFFLVSSQLPFSPFLCLLHTQKKIFFVTLIIFISVALFPPPQPPLLHLFSCPPPLLLFYYESTLIM